MTADSAIAIGWKARGKLSQPAEKLVMNRSVEGGVEVPFEAVCRVTDKPFQGVVTVTWKSYIVPEYEALHEEIRRICQEPTIAEELAVMARDAALNLIMSRFQGDELLIRNAGPGKGNPISDIVVSARVDVDGHLKAWAIAR